MAVGGGKFSVLTFVLGVSQRNEIKKRPDA